ncbi:MAG: hypothetical protein H6933_21325 [Burkholderiaceae bacterium]|nr:hypothetical protein [Burkholderiaceae bacterium]
MPQIHTSSTTRPGEAPARVIRLRADAPGKPDLGQPCNGCGVCCAWAPCPAGIWVSRRRQGRCRALGWDGSRYRCGLLAQPRRFVRWLPEAWTRRLAARWIAAGEGCDAALSTG